MESQKIKILLTKYWEGTSTLEEEAQLRKLFSGDVPVDEKQYAVLFDYKKAAAVEPDEDFNLDFLDGQLAGGKQSEVKSISGLVKWSMSIAATVLIVVMSVMYQWNGNSSDIAGDQDLALRAAAIDQVVHAVEAAQQGRLAAPARPDESRDLPIRYVQVNVLQRLYFVVEQVQILHANRRLAHLRDRLFRCGPGEVLQAELG